jgi:hypothetical protein
VTKWSFCPASIDHSYYTAATSSASSSTRALESESTVVARTTVGAVVPVGNRARDAGGVKDRRPRLHWLGKGFLSDKEQDRLKLKIDQMIRDRITPRPSSQFLFEEVHIEGSRCRIASGVT